MLHVARPLTANLCSHNHHRSPGYPPVCLKSSSGTSLVCAPVATCKTHQLLQLSHKTLVPRIPHQPCHISPATSAQPHQPCHISPATSAPHRPPSSRLHCCGLSPPCSRVQCCCLCSHCRSAGCDKTSCSPRPHNTPIGPRPHNTPYGPRPHNFPPVPSSHTPLKGPTTTPALVTLSPH